jgi:peptidoglycan/LPS O-acetylase OafA/YrhL
MYVFHALLNTLVGLPYLKSHGLYPPSVPFALAYIVVVAIATLGLAWISWRVLEEPFLRLKR